MTTTNNDRVVQVALSCIGLEAGNRATRDAFERVLGPGGPWDLDRPFRVVDGHVQGVSTCAMVGQGILRLAGAQIAQPPYRIGAGISDLRARAEKLPPYGAWAAPGRWSSPWPDPGDVVEIDPVPGSKSTSTHVLTVVDWERNVLVSVDGGQVGARGLQAIHQCRRTWNLRGGVPHLDDRPVRGWLVARLLFDD